MPIHGFASAIPVPLLMLSTKASWSRRRFSVMHEVGHLVMHKKASVPELREERERQADRFAGALLIPMAPFWREFPKPRVHFDWARLVEMKQRWGVSLQAIIHRAFDLKIIDAVQYRTANIHIAKYGWRTEEPAEQPIEEPEICAAFVDDLRKRSAIADLCARADLYAEVVGLTLRLPVEEQIECSEVIRLGGGPRNNPPKE